MSQVSDEIRSYLNLNSEDDSLEHYGMPRRSGRYPWGSGEDPYQHGGDFLSRIETLKKSGWTETPENIKEAFGLNTSQYRSQKSLALNERRSLEVARAKSLSEDGLSPTEIGKIMGKNESSIRSLLNANSERKMNQARDTAEFLKKQIQEKGMIDVGTGVEIELNISREKLNQALKILQEEGYPLYKGGIPQVTNKGKQINQMVICPPGTEHKEIYNFDNVHTITDYTSHDNGKTFKKFVYPESLNSDRLMIRYADDAGPDGVKGIQKDGVIELRRGVADLDLGASKYAQVRILVDGKRYLKGMAVYSDDLPDGVDVVFNTNKNNSVPKMEVLKKIKNDPDNPFGANIKPNGQSYYIDKNGKEKLSPINKTREEGDWTSWKDKLPSQFLSKQSLSLAKRQLKLSLMDKETELDEIHALNNPTVRKNRLMSFADDCDASAVHLQAAALPGQKYHVILPLNSLNENEIYAPNYKNGTKLALIRFPHAGTFEIPICIVNNKKIDGKKMIGKDSIDAVGINSKVAERLSGADFDGDTVMCIPANSKGGKITSSKSLKGLKNFDPKTEYGGEVRVDSDGKEHYYRNGKEYRIMKNTQTEMGKISNLITDMTLKGAKESEMAAAVRHSMVVIDAEKHHLDYKQSELDNNISALKKVYQNGGGASTLISRAKGEVSVEKRQGSPKINLKGKEWYDPSKPEGSLVYNKADDLEYQVTRTNKKTGEVTTVTKKRMQASSKMAETDDAYSLVSSMDTPMERAYADYANTLKSMANKARIEAANTGKVAYSPSANKIYQAEATSLMSKLKTALVNAPKERRAQALANAEIKTKKESNPEMTVADEKKLSQQALTRYRNEVGASRSPITITTKEWEAIQSGAISESKLTQILNYVDKDNLRQLTSPRSSTTLSEAKINKLKAMANSDYTLSEIADSIGVSTSTVSEYLKGGK